MPNIPRPEHPRPDAVRSEWLNLNGVWEFAETDDSSDERYLQGGPYPDRITVPFCRESKLSGLARRGFVKNVWYRRTFDMPTGWQSPRTRLHIGASDWLTRVWVNGHLLGEHKGGSAPFAFDATKWLKPNGNVLVIHAFDDTRSGLQPLGKQSQREESHGCLYTRTTGIWQTVWLEGVGSSFIREFHAEPDPDSSRVMLRVEVDGPCQDLSINAVARAASKVIGSAQVPADWRNARLALDLSEKRLWSTDNPFIYDLKLTLTRGGQVVDSVDSYFGLRSVSIRGAAILINGKPIFQRLVLDQGFYPDGVWTAPSDDALRRDIELSKAAGFNGARLHQKVFEPRFLYWADKLGYLLWGEYPNWGPDYANPAVNLPITDEWVEVVRRDRNHPSIIGWCPFNETPDQAVELQNSIAKLTRTLDPSRPIIDTSGWTHGLHDAEVMDDHDYEQRPQVFRARWTDSFSDTGLPARYRLMHVPENVPFMVSEYGGIGWNVGGGWGYGQAPQSLDEFYSRHKGLTDALLDNRLMFGFCYTQLTDVEQECNGIYTFDRQAKFDISRIHAHNSRPAAYENDPPLETRETTDAWRVLVGACPDGHLARKWRYSLSQPAEDWTMPNFDDSTWQEGLGGFGQKDGWEKLTRTPWTGKDIWLRQEFEADGETPDKALLVIHYDNTTEVYLNGKKIWSGEGWNNRYAGFDVTQTVRTAIKPGRNRIAVRCHQDEGGQFIDLALLSSVRSW